MEATSVAAMIARIIEGHVARVVVCKAQDLPVARAKTDRLDAQTLARLLARVIYGRCGCLTSSRVSCAAAVPGARTWCVLALARRTRCMPC